MMSCYSSGDVGIPQFSSLQATLPKDKVCETWQQRAHILLRIPELDFISNSGKKQFWLLAHETDYWLELLDYVYCLHVV